MGRITMLVALALCGFAANSLLCRHALTATMIDAASFSAWRLGAGAAVLVLLAARGHGRAVLRAGDWRGAAALLVYVLLFSYAYVALPAAVGALLLFGAVQVTMLVAAHRDGERLGARRWSGALLALAGLMVLQWPAGGGDTHAVVSASGPAREGVAAALPAVLMLGAGVAWAIYTLLGRGARSPLALTAGNFLRAAPFALLWLACAPHPLSMPRDGVAYAVLSGALASGIGYALWYAALPQLRASQAALLQLLVPVLTAAAGVAWLGETLDARVLLGGSAILAGVAFALVSRAGAPRR